MEEEKAYNDIIITNLDQLVGELDDKIVEMRENNEEKGKIKGTQFKVINFKKALKNIKDYSEPIYKADQLKGIKGIGKGILSRVEEIISTGTLKNEIEVDDKKKGEMLEKKKLQKLTGIGPSKSNKLLKSGITLDLLLSERNKLGDNDFKENKFLKELTHHQIIGLKYYEDLEKRIPRKHIENIDKKLSEILKQDKWSGIIYKICGSYRRNMEDSGDIDILMSYKDFNEEKDKNRYLPKIVKELTEKKIIIDNLTTLGTSKYMGICRIPGYDVACRIDIRLVPYHCYIPAILYFTGSANENVRLRNIAIQKGYKINEYGLFKLSDKGEEKIILNDEKDLYKILGEDYKEPYERIL